MQGHFEVYTFKSMLVFILLYTHGIIGIVLWAPYTASLSPPCYGSPLPWLPSLSPLPCLLVLSPFNHGKGESEGDHDKGDHFYPYQVTFN